MPPLLVVYLVATQPLQMLAGGQEADGGEVQDRHKQVVLQQATLLDDSSTCLNGVTDDLAEVGMCCMVTV